MVLLDELNTLKLYKRKFVAPFIETDKRHGSLVFIMGTDINNSMNIMKNKFMEPRYTMSYYFERKATIFLNNDGTPVEEYADIDDFHFRCSQNTGFINEDYLRINSGEGNFAVMLSEDAKYDARVKKIIWNERYKTVQELNTTYDKIKTNVPYITKTYYDIDRYKGLNLFVDLSYYLYLFNKNNVAKLDKGMVLYQEFLNRLFTRVDYSKSGYKKKTIMIDMVAWKKATKSTTITDLMDWKKTINPLSYIHYIIRKTHSSFSKVIPESIDIIIFGQEGYLKINSEELTMDNLVKIKFLLNKLDANSIDDEDTAKDSKKVIAMKSIDDIEKAKDIIINNIKPKYLSGVDPDKLTYTTDVIGIPLDQDKKVEPVKNPRKIVKPVDKKVEKKVNADIADQEKQNLVDNISKIAASSDNKDEVINAVDNNSNIQSIINKINNTTKPSAKSIARQARIDSLHSEFLKKKINNKPIKDMVEESEKITPIKETPINIDSINEEWKHMTFTNFNKDYDPNNDIIAILYFLGTLSHPISVLDIDIKDTTTSDDMIYTYTVSCETETGKRFSFVFDIPKIKDGKFMRLRGNDKTLNNQLVLLPCIKTDSDTVQLVSNYKKIFVRRYGTSVGKSSAVMDRLIKGLLKYDGTQLKIKQGDSSRLCSKYNVSYEYSDMSSVIMKIETPTDIFYFNPDEIIATYSISDENIVKYNINGNFPIGYNKKNKMLIESIPNTNLATQILDIIRTSCPEFYDLCCSQAPSTKYCYSMASILNTEIPVIVVLGYTFGLNKVIQTFGNIIGITDKVPPRKDIYTGYIKFKYGYITFPNYGAAGMLFNGLKDCDTEEYSLEDINDKNMWLDFLDNFGGRIKADGLDNFADLFVDPKTKVICQAYNLPDNYFDMLIYTNTLLCVNNYNKHVDLTGNRFRSNELIAGYAYYCISTAYGVFANAFKRKNTSIMTMKQSAIIDAILEDPTCSDLSIETPLLENETSSAVGFKGLSGLNSDRAYSLDKRTYDETMVNKLALSTGFAENVGITRQSTIDMDIKNNIGTLGDESDTSDMCITKTFSITEAMNPYTTTRDDPFRIAMTFVQSSKHTMRTAISHPLLVTNGADEAIAYMTTDTFAWKAKGPGIIAEKTDDYMVIKYNDSSIPNEFVNLKETVKKNSDGGFFLTIQLKTDLKAGDKVKANQIVAYDHQAYNNMVGATDNIAATPGILAKIAIPMTEEGYEDSTIITNYLSRAMESEVVIKKEKYIQKNSNVYYLAKPGQKIQEGEPILIFQNAYDDNDVNILLKNLATDELGTDEVSDLGRITIKSKYTGIIEDVQILRTVDVSEMSESLQKIVKPYEANIRKLKSVMNKYETKDRNAFAADYKLPATGGLKDCPDGVKIIIYIKYFDKMSVGDKIVNWAALKGVVRSIPPEGEEMYSEYRPNEEVSSMFSINSVNARMVASIQIIGAIDKGLIELDRQVKEIMGIPWKTLKDYDLEMLDMIEGNTIEEKPIKKKTK